nr:MAG TPA: hypothetical protein [Crassvirales sp.]
MILFSEYLKGKYAKELSNYQSFSSHKMIYWYD